MLADNGSTHGLYAEPCGLQHEKAALQLAAVKAGEDREPVLVTRLQIWTMQQLGLDLSPEQAREEIQKEAKGSRPVALRREVRSSMKRGVRFCWRHMAGKQIKDVR